MKRFIIILVSVSLQGLGAFGATFRYVNMTDGERTVAVRSTKNMDIEMNSETPKSLRIFDKNCVLDTPLSFIRTGPDSWEECYLIRSVNRSGILRTRV